MAGNKLRAPGEKMSGSVQRVKKNKRPELIFPTKGLRGEWREPKTRNETDFFFFTEHYRRGNELKTLKPLKLPDKFETGYHLPAKTGACAESPLSRRKHMCSSLPANHRGGV